ncbi:MAG: ATP synthase F1 subunit delta [Alphaproteobacteria bacterium]|nr:ATP synthase F1 subunit delta [Alphaproteobacteria bacterium]
MTLNSELRQVSKRYATALFKLSVDNKSLDKVVKCVSSLQKVLNSSDKLSSVIKSPALKIDEAEAILNEILKKLKSSDELKGLIKTLCQNRRQFALSNVLEQFMELVDEHNGIVNAEVISANKLSSKQTKQVEKAVAEVVGGDIRVSYIVKPAIIGGLIVKIGSKMLDSCTQTKLDKLKQEMKGV